MARRLLPALAASLVMLGCASSDRTGGENATKPRTLSVALRDSTIGHHEVLEDQVEHLSGGSLRLKVRSGWRQDEGNPERGTIADVRSGRFDMALVHVRGLDTLGVDAFQPLVAPFQIDSLELERRVLADDVSTRAVDAVDRLGLVGVGLLPGALRRPLGITQRLVAARDYRGAEVGVRASEIAARTMRALGAEPALFAGEMDAGFDAIESDFQNTRGLDPGLDGRTLTVNEVLWPRTLLLVANRGVWAELGEHHRATLRRATRDALDTEVRWLARDEDEGRNVICRHGQMRLARASARELDQLRAAVRPVLDGIRDQAAIARIAKLRADTPSPRVPSCPRPPAPAAGRSSPIDGVWETRNDPGDARRLGHSDEGIEAENWGHWITAYSRGRFGYSQENARACTWGYGTFRVQGRRLIVDYLDGGGIAPNQATNKPGEHFEFTWSRYRDVLRLATVHDAVSPDNFTQTPLRLIGRDAARAPFAHRCAPPLKAVAR